MMTPFPSVPLAPWLLHSALFASSGVYCLLPRSSFCTLILSACAYHPVTGALGAFLTHVDHTAPYRPSVSRAHWM